MGEILAGLYANQSKHSPESQSNRNKADILLTLVEYIEKDLKGITTKEDYLALRQHPLWTSVLTNEDKDLLMRSYLDDIPYAIREQLIFLFLEDGLYSTISDGNRLEKHLIRSRKPIMFRNPIVFLIFRWVIIGAAALLLFRIAFFILVNPWL